MAVALACVLLGAGIGHAAEINTSTATRYQMIEGWGTSMSNSWREQTPYYNPAWRAAYRDLGLNILRVDMDKEVLVASNGQLGTPVPLGDSLQSNINLMNFDHEKFKLYGDMAAWLSDNALEPGRVKIVGAVWSPPHWMKGPTSFTVNGNTTPYWSGTESVGGRLLQTEDNLQQFGRYLAAWVEGFEQHYGVPMHAISLQNESTFENPFDSMTYERGPAGELGQYWQYANALKAVKDAWQQYGVTTKIKGPHVFNVGNSPTQVGHLNNQIGYINAVKNHADPELIDFLDYYNSNGYMNSSATGARMWSAYWNGTDAVTDVTWSTTVNKQGVKGDGKPIWVSEAGGEEATWLAYNSSGTQIGAIIVAVQLYNALVHGNASTYIYWQLSDHIANETGSTLLGNNATAISSPTSSKKYAAFKQFSRFIRPGAVRIGALVDDGTFGDEPSTLGTSKYDTRGGLSIAAFLHEQDLTLTYVLLNLTASSQPITINLPAGLDVSQLNGYITSETQSFASLTSLTQTENQILLTAPAYSVITLHGMFTAVPEPGALALFACGCALLTPWRRRRRARTF